MAAKFNLPIFFSTNCYITSGINFQKVIDFFQFFFVLLFADFGEDWSFVIFLVKMNDWIETALKIMARIKASCLVFFRENAYFGIYITFTVFSITASQKRLSIFNNIKAFYIYIICFYVWLYILFYFSGTSTTSQRRLFTFPNIMTTTRIFLDI